MGSFVGERWQEWNGKFRDDIRAWVRGDHGSITRFPSRLLGSPDIYEDDNREPEQSVNFVACHDGFTLNDVVSYNHKHNKDNGEENRDGADENFSWNHGIEGPTDDPAIESLRARQVKNLFAYTLLSMGVPMIQMGDEVRRTQRGNNNAYSQDNEISWFDWSQVAEQAELRNFVKNLIHFRLNEMADMDDEGRTLAEELREAHITWHGTHLNQPDWSPDSRSLALTLEVRNLVRPRRLMHYMFNSFWEPLDFELPPLPSGASWQRLLDTSLPSPDDMVALETAEEVAGRVYHVADRSVVLLVAKLDGVQTGYTGRLP